MKGSHLAAVVAGLALSWCSRVFGGVVSTAHMCLCTDCGVCACVYVRVRVCMSRIWAGRKQYVALHAVALLCVCVCSVVCCLVAEAWALQAQDSTWITWNFLEAWSIRGTWGHVLATGAAVCALDCVCVCLCGLCARAVYKATTTHYQALTPSRMDCPSTTLLARGTTCRRAPVLTSCGELASYWQCQPFALLLPQL